MYNCNVNDNSKTNFQILVIGFTMCFFDCQYLKNDQVYLYEF